MKKFFVGLLASLGGLTLLCILSVFVLYKSNQVAYQTIDKNTVLFIDFSTEIAEYESSGGLEKILQGPSNSLYAMINAIDKASEDPNIVGIIARIDHSTLGLAQTQEVRNAILRFRSAGRDAGKFTIAYADTFGELSQGTRNYYLASAFDEVWMQPIGMVGFTGLYAEQPFARKALDALGIHPEIGKRREYKSATELYTEEKMSDAAREALATVIDSVMDHIIRDVGLSRELGVSEVRDAVAKAPLFPREALKAGLIDRQAYFDEIRPYVNLKVPGQIKLVSINTYLEANPDKKPEKGKPKIAVVFASGQIIRDVSNPGNTWNGGYVSTSETVQSFKNISEDRDVTAVVFRINSPGGSPVASESILRAMRKAQQAGKKVVVSMSDVAGSGGYWIAAYADKIVANPSTITGSIGVLGGKVVLKDAWDKLGINWDSVSTSPNADMWSMNKGYTDYGSQRLENWLDHIYDQFITRVSEGRKLPREHVEQVAKGRIWSGEDALKYGLVDKLGDLGDAITLAKDISGLVEQDIPVQLYPRPMTLLERLELSLNGPNPDIGTSAPSPFKGIFTFLKNLSSILFNLTASPSVLMTEEISG